MKRVFGILVLLPALSWAQSDANTGTPVPAAPTPGQQALVNACLQDMPHRVGMFQNHGALVCSCMFTGTTAWRADPDPAKAEAQSTLLAAAITRGGMSLDLRATGQSEGMDKKLLDKLGTLARVYPAVLFQNKAVVQCFNDNCRTTAGCEFKMNDISGTAPRPH